MNNYENKFGVIITITGAKVQRKVKSEKRKVKNLPAPTMFLTYIKKKKLAAPFGTANFSLSHFLNVSITILDLQQRVLYQPHYPHTS